MTHQKLESLIHAAEEIAKEKHDPGVNTRHLFIALGRSVV